MAVLVNDGQQQLIEILRSILAAFLTEADYARGVFIKPNVVFPVRPESGEITSPVLVRTLVSALRERHARIDVVLGEGVAAGCDPQENFRVSGYDELARELNVPLLDLNQVEHRALPWRFGKLELPCIALDRTYINLPILKPSSACVISGALKNQKGLVPPDVKKKFHRGGLHRQIAELNAVVKPTLTIMDGSHFFGRRVFLSGDNCGEIDATACSLLGIEEPEHVKLSRTAGVFAADYRPEEHKIYNGRASSRLKAREFKRLGRLRLWANPRACTMCRYLFHEIKQDAPTLRDIPAKAKLLSYSIRGAELVMGLRPQWRKEYGTVICVGNCTRRVAKEGGYLFIPGCPPTLRDFYDNLLNQEGPDKAEG